MPSSTDKLDVYVEGRIKVLVFTYPFHASFAVPMPVPVRLDPPITWEWSLKRWVIGLEARFTFT